VCLCVLRQGLGRSAQDAGTSDACERIQEEQVSLPCTLTYLLSLPSVAVSVFVWYGCLKNLTRLLSFCSHVLCVIVYDRPLSEVG